MMGEQAEFVSTFNTQQMSESLAYAYHAAGTHLPLKAHVKQAGM